MTPQAYHIAHKSQLSILPLTLREANKFVDEHHRHHKVERGCKFAIGCLTDKGLVGVAICGRPKARAWDDGLTLEVTRTCTDGTANANSFLYGACYRIGREMGYRRVITYTQEGESGASLRAAAWEIIASRKPRKNWSESSVRLKAMRDPDYNSGGIARLVWEKVCI